MHKWPSIVTPAILTQGLFLAYALATTHHFTEDSVTYVREALVGGASSFHPHHLLYHGVMALVVRALAFGPADVESSMRAMQWANICFSTAAVLVFYQVCRTLGASLGAAAAFALLFGLASGFFEFSSQVEVYNITCLFLCVAALGMADSTARPGRRLLVGAGYYFAMCFHQVAVFLGVAIWIDEWGRGTGRARWAGLLRSLGLPLGAIGASYTGVGLALGHRTPAALWEWITRYAQAPFWGLGRLNAATVRELTVGIGKALVDVTHLPKWILAAAVLALGAFVGLRWPVRPRTKARQRFMLALLAWLMAYGLFMAWWTPGNVEAWIAATVPAFSILASLATGAEAARLPAVRRVAGWVALGACLTLMVATDIQAYRRDRAPNLAREAALQALAVVRPGDILLTVDTFKGAYFKLYLTGSGASIEAVNHGIALEAAAQAETAQFTPAVVAQIATRCRAARARGARCYVDAWVQRGAIPRFRYMKDLEPQQFKAILQDTFTLRPVTASATALVYEIAEIQAPPGPR